MNTAALSGRIWYITRYLRVILAEYKPSNLPTSFLPKYGLVEILRSVLSAIFLRPALNNFCKPALACGEYSSAKVIDSAEDGQKCLYGKESFFSSGFLRQTGSYSIAFCHSEFQESPVETRSHLWEYPALKGSFYVLVNKLFLAAGIHRVQKQQELSEPYFHLQNKSTTGDGFCQEDRNRVINAGVWQDWSREFRRLGDYSGN